MFLKNISSEWNRVNYTTTFMYICEDFPMLYSKGITGDVFESNGVIDYKKFIQQVKRN